eukprot:5363393-Alexandrium_andersonii.AAC.1
MLTRRSSRTRTRTWARTRRWPASESAGRVRFRCSLLVALGPRPKALGPWPCSCWPLAQGFEFESAGAMPLCSNR